MTAPFSRFIQVAGVLDLAEALMLVEEGVHGIGIPLRLPVHRPDMAEEQAAEVFEALEGKALRVVITYEEDPREVVELARSVHADCVQLHSEWDGDPDRAARVLARVRELDSDLLVIKSLIVRDEAGSMVRDAGRFAPHCHAFLTDSFDPATGACGATGRVHDWNRSRELAGSTSVPVILAGGLTPDNVARAIDAVHPMGVDAHTGLEDGSGRKSRKLVRTFVQQARQAFSRLD